MKLKKLIHIFLLFFLLSATSNAQYTAFRKDNKWGFTKDGADFIPAIYDTVMPFDSTKKICMACIKTQKPSPNKFIKMNNNIILCKYLNQNKEQLIIQTKKDTCSYFSFNKNAISSYSNHKKYIVVQSKDKKFVVDEHFKQITFTPYDEIIPLAIKDHFLVEIKTEVASFIDGVIDATEKIVIPIEYTHIKANPFDTLFIACTAQIKLMGLDDVYDLSGKKIYSFNRHIDNASKNFSIHKVYEPYEHYIINELLTKKEKSINAEDITYLGDDVINIKIKGKYYKSSMFKLDELKIPEQ